MSQATYFSNSPEDDLDNSVLDEIQFADTGNAILFDLGGAHACSVGQSGNMKCWGNGTTGQLGLVNTQNVGDSATEVEEGLPFVDIGSGLSVESLALADSYSCSLFTNG